MDEEKQKDIVEFAKENNIEVRKFIPDFRSKSSKDYKSISILKKQKSKGSYTEEEQDSSDLSASDQMEIHEENEETQTDGENQRPGSRDTAQCRGFYIPDLCC